MCRLLKLMGVIGLLLSVLLLIPRLRPYQSESLAALAPSGCELPCALGIRLDDGDPSAVLDRLRGNPRVNAASIQIVHPVENPIEESIIWTWAVDPVLPDAPSYITLRNGHVTRIDLALSLPAIEMLAVAGQPTRTFSVVRVEGTEMGWYYPALNSFVLIAPGCGTHKSQVYALQIRLVQAPEPYTDFARWHGLRAWQNYWCR